MIKDLQILIENSESIELIDFKMQILGDLAIAKASTIKFNFIKGKVELA